MSPYRNILDEARQKLAEARSALSARASTLGALRPLLPRGLRRELDQLERAIERPVRHVRDVEDAERSLAEYEERLEVAIAFSDHVVREHAARWRQQRLWLRCAMAGAAVVGFLTVCVVVHGSFFARRFHAERTPGVCALGAAELGGAVAGSDAAPAGNPCGLSTECARHGRCATAVDGCFVSSSDDCGSSWDCKIDGMCDLVAGRCSAETDLGCAASRQCELEGRCTAYGGECLSVSDFTGLVAAEPRLVRSSH